MTNHFEIFINWPWFLFMFYRGCSRFFLSCQFKSFLHELQDRKKKKTNWNVLVSFFFLSFCFGSCNTDAVFASKQSREPKKSTQNFMRIEISIAKASFLRKASFSSLYKQRRAKRMSCEERFNQWFIIFLLKIHNLTLFNRILFFLGTCRKNLPFKMDSFRKVLTILSRRN